jgi:hypothetical protein
MPCSLVGGKRRKSRKTRGRKSRGRKLDMFRHTRHYLGAVGSDLKRYGTGTRRYLGAVPGRVRRYGSSLMHRAGKFRRKTLGFR